MFQFSAFHWKLLLGSQRIWFLSDLSTLNLANFSVPEPSSRTATLVSNIPIPELWNMICESVFKNRLEKHLSGIACTGMILPWAGGWTSWTFENPFNPIFLLSMTYLHCYKKEQTHNIHPYARVKCSNTKPSSQKKIVLKIQQYKLVPCMYCMPTP